MAAVKHGAYSPRVVEFFAERIAARIVAERPGAADITDEVLILSRLKAKVFLLEEWLFKRWVDLIKGNGIWDRMDFGKIPEIEQRFLFECSFVRQQAAAVKAECIEETWNEWVKDLAPHMGGASWRPTWKQWTKGCRVCGVIRGESWCPHQ